MEGWIKICLDLDLYSLICDSCFLRSSGVAELHTYELEGHMTNTFELRESHYMKCTRRALGNQI